MKQIISLLFMVIAVCSCAKKNPADDIHKIIDDATSKVEKANTIKEIENINDRLIQRIASLSLAMSNEEYEEWASSSKAYNLVEEAKNRYANAKQNREKFLLKKE